MWRLARNQDDAAVIALWQALNREDVAEHPPPLAYVVRTLEVLRTHPERGRVAVLQLQGTIVGYAVLINLWDNEQGGELCVVDELYVAPSHRGSGHATALLQGIAKGCEVWPTPPAGVQLEVSPDNAEARRLYERLGFVAIRNIGMRRSL